MTTIAKVFNTKMEEAFQEYCLQKFAKLKLSQAAYQEDIQRCNKGLAQVEKQIEEFNMDTCRKDFRDDPSTEYGSTHLTQAIKSMTGASNGQATRSTSSSHSRSR